MIFAKIILLFVGFLSCNCLHGWRSQSVIQKAPLRSLEAPEKAMESRSWTGYLATENVISHEISLENPFGNPCSRVSDAKMELLQLVDFPSKTFDVHSRIDYLAKVLQSSFIPFQTIPFLNLAISGDWNKSYSSIRCPRPSPDFYFHITQSIIPHSLQAKGGLLIDTVQWKYIDNSLPEVNYSGQFEIRSNFSYSRKGELQILLDEHLLRPETSVPENVEEFIYEIQRSIPFDSFDPSDAVIQTMVSETASYVILVTLLLFSM